ncbi:MAG TPA: hypothetical protein VGM94_00255 [Galbitalea sp.]|jgi:hypothetical protein
MRTRSLGVAVAASIIVLASVSGCASAAGGSHGLATAKSATLKLESEIASFVPEAMVTRTHQTTTSKVLYPCLGHSGQSYWPGTETVGLKQGVDTDAVLAAIASNWTNKSGWTAFKSTGADGSASLNIKSTKGQSFTVAFVDGPQLSISALSTCFPSDGLAGQSSY